MLLVLIATIYIRGLPCIRMVTFITAFMFFGRQCYPCSGGREQAQAGEHFARQYTTCEERKPGFKNSSILKLVNLEPSILTLPIHTLESFHQELGRQAPWERKEGILHPTDIRQQQVPG